MSTSARRRSTVIGFLGILVLSSLLMVWMFWHFPRGTSIATLIVLSGLAISARLARWVDTDLETERRRKQEV